MKSKHLVFLAVTLAVLALACALLLQRERASWQSAPALAGSKVLPVFDPNAVAEVRVKSGDGTVTLVRKNDAWTVAESGGYAANFDLVRPFIRRLWELKAVQDVAADGSQLAQFQLVAPAEGRADTGTLVELKDAAGKRLAALLAGKPFQRTSPDGGGFPAGRFVMADDGKNRVVLVSDSFYELAQPAKDWLDRNFVQIADLRSISLDGPAGKWTLSRADTPDAPWKLDGDTPPDTAKSDAAINAVRSLFFENVAAADDKKFDFSQPDTVTVRTPEGLTYVWTIGKPVGEACPVKLVVSGSFEAAQPAAEGNAEKQKSGKTDKELAEKREAFEKRLAEQKKFEGWVFLIPRSLLNALLVSKKDLLPAPSPTPSPSPVQSPTPGPSPVQN